MSGLLSVPRVRLSALSVAVPENRVSNKSHLDLFSQDEDLVGQIGIRYRYVSQRQTISDLLLPTVRHMLTQRSLSPSEIGLLVLVTQTGDQQIPNTALALQHHLGLPTQALVLELNMGCAGYVCGLYTTAQLLNALPTQHALLLTGDISTMCVHPEDSSTLPLFSDAVSATLIEKCPTADAWQFLWQNSGQKHDVIKMRSGKKQTPWAFFPDAYLKMDGMSVFQFALKEVVDQVRQLMTELKLSVKDIDYFVFHQANRIINESVRRSLGIPLKKHPYSLLHYGNVSSATLPLTLATQLAEPLQSGNKKLVLCGFGAGLAWSTAHIHTSPFDILPILKVPPLSRARG